MQITLNTFLKYILSITCNLVIILLSCYNNLLSRTYEQQLSRCYDIISRYNNF